MADEEDVRRIALSLPGTTEKPSYGTPGFRVADRLFARLHDEPGVLVIWLPDVEERGVLVAAEPGKFFFTPHYQAHPLVLVRLAAVDETELTELLTDAWRCRAPQRLRQRLET